MGKYTPIDRRESRPLVSTEPLRSRQERQATRVPVTRGYRESERRQPERLQRSPRFLWIFSISALCPDGESFTHDVAYSLNSTGERAQDAGWKLCFENYPKAEGYTFQDVQMMQVAPEHINMAIVEV